MLDYDENSPPVIFVETDKDGNELWKIDPDVHQSWRDLEDLLRSALIAMITLAPSNVPPFFRWWNMPFQYHRYPVYVGKPGIVEILQRVRNTFIPLMAALSMAYLGLVQKQDQDSSWATTWRSQFLSKTNVHPQWLSDLESSCVCNVELPRAGGIIHASEFEVLRSDQRSYAHLLPYLCYFNAPLMICWGSIRGEKTLAGVRSIIPIPSPPSRLSEQLAPRQLIPGFNDIQVLVNHKDSYLVHLRSDQEAKAFPCIIPLCYATKQASAPPSRFPPVVPYSGQRQDETWQAFFARREAHDVAREDKESAEEKKERMARIKTSTKLGKSTKKKMYVWVKTEGFYIRTPAGKQNYETVFEDYGPRQRRFNSHRNEWDLCSDFDPDDDVACDSDFDDILPVSDENSFVASYHDPAQRALANINTQPALGNNDAQSTCTNLPGTMQDPQRLRQLAGGYLSRRYGQPTFFHPPLVFCKSAAHCAFMRFGFIILPTVGESSSRLILPPHVSNLLGCAHSVELHPQNADEAKRLTSYCTSLAAAKRTAELPAGTHDLEDPRHLSLHSSFHCRTLRFDDNDYYFLHPVNRPNPQYFVVLHEPHSVLDVMRHELEPSHHALIDHLVRRGITFNTMIASSTRPSSTLNKNRHDEFTESTSLGYRPLGYQPTEADYASYKTQRRRFFNLSKGRCCLMRGGVIWRLAREYVNVETVYQGPSPECVFDGFFLWDGQADSSSYWDDGLSPDELDLILGVYKVETGKSWVEYVFNILMPSQSNHLANGSELRRIHPKNLPLGRRTTLTGQRRGHGRIQG